MDNEYGQEDLWWSWDEVKWKEAKVERKRAREEGKKNKYLDWSRQVNSLTHFTMFADPLSTL